MQKRAVAIHDISCVGKCSITVALPIISAAGVECSILPTAVLSTHTGGFEGYTYLDLTDEIMPIAEHWKSIDLKVDAIYTGYLGSFRQIELVEKVIDMFRRPETVVLVDPVMADNGAFYTGFDRAFAAGMRKLCAKADIIIPNFTEAAFLLDEPYNGEELGRDETLALCRRLHEACGCKVVLTGASTSKDNLGAAVFDPAAGTVEYALTDRVDGRQHGTGDVFGSSFLGAYMNGKSLVRSAQIAAEYTRESIDLAFKNGAQSRDGADFEQALPVYLQALQN